MAEHVDEVRILVPGCESEGKQTFQRYDVNGVTVLVEGTAYGDPENLPNQLDVERCILAL